jgi:hypothetical protein
LGFDLTLFPMPLALRAALYTLSLSLFAAPLRAQFYAEAAGGVAWTHWRVNKIVRFVNEPVPGDRDESVNRWELTAGWRVKTWLAFEASFAGGGAVHNAGSYGITTLLFVPPGEPNYNSIVDTRSEYRRHMDVFAAGPVLSLPLGGAVRLFTRQQIAATSLRTHISTRSYHGIAYAEPPISQLPVTSIFETENSWRWQPAVGVEWSPPRLPHWSVAVIGMRLHASTEKFTSCLARVGRTF